MHACAWKVSVNIILDISDFIQANNIKVLTLSLPISFFTPYEFIIRFYKNMY